MSGGSFNYLYSKMEEGKIDGFLEYVSLLVRELETLRDMVQEGKPIVWDGEKYILCQTQSATLLSIDTVIVTMNRAAKLAGRVQESMRSLAPIAYAIEWWKSSDTGPEDTANACEQWFRRQLGIEESK